MLHIVPEAVEVPGRCAVSQSTAGPFVDTLITIPRHGRLYLSVPWLNTLAPDLGWVPAPELAGALEDLDEALCANGPLADRVERFEEDIANVSEAMVAWLGDMRSRSTLLDELKAAREAIDVLAEKVVELEAASGA